MLGRSFSSVRAKVYRLGLKYEGSRVNAGCFNKGQQPWNKGKEWGYHPRTKKTWFKPGQKPPTAKPAGSVFIRSDHGKDTLYIKAEAMGYAEPYHRWLWQQVYGEIPEGCVIGFKDFNRMNVTISNLECLTRAENMQRINKKRTAQQRHRSAVKAWSTRDNNMRERLGLPI